MSKVSIIGAYNTKFGAFVEKNKETGEIKDTKTYYELLIEAGQGAIKNAGLEAKDIDGLWVLRGCPGRVEICPDHKNRRCLCIFVGGNLQCHLRY